MRFVTNGTFAILLIPECKQYGISEAGRHNNFVFDNIYNPNLDYIIPYRKPYSRIIRAIAADLHEVMLDAGFVNLNKTVWSTVREQCLEYILDWVENKGHLPIIKNFCHTGYITAYMSPEITKAKIIDVDNINELSTYIKETYNVDIGQIPELPGSFYDYTVPYWEIDQIYNNNEKMRTLIDEWCARDIKESTRLLGIPV
jgi:hypothetical protein